MKPDELRELTSRLIAGEDLSAAEQNALLVEMQKTGKREIILADEAVDSLLRDFAHRVPSIEEFVASTMERVDQAGRDPFDFPSTGVQVPARYRRTDRSRNRFRWMLLFASVVTAIPAAVFVLNPRHDNQLNVQDPAPSVPLRETTPPQTAEKSPDSGTNAKPRVPNEPQIEPRKEPPGEPKSDVPDLRFVSLTKLEDAEWETPLREGDRLAAGILKLKKGSAEFLFDQGTRAKLTGPAEIDFRNGNEVFLHKGTIIAEVPGNGMSLLVRTPVSRMVDRGSEVEVHVGERGKTEATVRKGKVTLTPHRSGERAAKSLELVAGELDHAVVSLPDSDAKLLPLSTKVSGSKGQFRGLVSVNGKTGVFQTQDAFQTFERAVIGQLRQSPVQFQQSWSINVQVSGRGAMAFAAIVINGERYQIEVYGDDGDTNR